MCFYNPALISCHLFTSAYYNQRLISYSIVTQSYHFSSVMHIKTIPLLLKTSLPILAKFAFAYKISPAEPILAAKTAPLATFRPPVKHEFAAIYSHLYSTSETRAKCASNIIARKLDRTEQSSATNM